MRIKVGAGIAVTVAVVALIVGTFVVVGGLISGNVIDGVSEGLEGIGEVIDGPSLESTLDDAVDDFGVGAPVVGLTIRPQDMIYELRTGSEVTERHISVQETSRYDPFENRQISGATIETRDRTRGASRGERKLNHPTLGDLDPAAQDRMAAAAGVSPARLTAELEGDRWLLITENGDTLVAELDGTPDG